MMRIKTVFLTLTSLAASTVAPVLHAQLAVIDVASIAQLVRQLTTMEQQLATLQSQLQAITGDRGMENLLSGVNRNYLPTDWASLMAAMAGVGTLGAGVQSNIAANTVLSPDVFGSLSGTEQAEVLSDQQNAALLEATVQQALATTSNRFGDLQQLITAIGAAPDAKASADLQVRVSAEAVMVQNDQTKLQVLYQAVQAQLQIQAERLREQALSDIGSLRMLPAMGL